MCSITDLNAILKELSEIYHNIYGNDIVKILVYGSYVRGTFNDDSDVDIVAIVKGDREGLQEKLRLVWEKSSELELQYETILSPTVIPYDEFEKYKRDIPYYRNIDREGVEIVA